MVKRLISLVVLIAFTLSASDFVQYDIASTPIANRVVRWMPSQNTPEYAGVPGFLQITNIAAQRGAGVTLTNLYSCVVDGQLVRLMTQAELDIIAAANAVAASNALVQAKYDARVFATNVINGEDGLSLYIRAMGEANWFFLNQIRTNDGKPALSRAAYKNTIDANIDAFGQ